MAQHNLILHAVDVDVAQVVKLIEDREALLAALKLFIAWNMDESELEDALNAAHTAIAKATAQ